MIVKHIRDRYDQELSMTYACHEDENDHVWSVHKKNSKIYNHSILQYKPQPSASKIVVGVNKYHAGLILV